VTQTHPNVRRGVLFVVASALLWSTGGLGVKAITDAPLKVAFYRNAFAALALLAGFGPRRFRWTRPFLVAVVSYAGCLTTFVVATRWTTAANAILLQYSGVVWVMLAAPFVTRDPLSRKDVIAVVIALVGMALFFIGKFSAEGTSGNIVAVVSGAFFASLVLALRIERGEGAEAAVMYGNVLGAVVLLPFVAVTSGLGLTWRSAGVLGFLGVFQIGLAYALFVRGLRDVSATQASLTGMIEPVANPIWVFVLIGERPSRFAILGGAIVLAAIAWRTVSSDQPAAEMPVD
jgi:drug/metabolite transporter (DMT)-like permease